MTNKRVKYYSILVLIIMLIAFSIGILGYNANKDSAADAGGRDEIVEPDIPLPDVPDDEDDDVSSDVPSSRFPMKLVLYAVDIVNNGKGYYSSYYQEATSHVAGTKEKQIIKATKQRSGDINLEFDYATSTTFLAEKFARTIYADKKEDKYQFVKTSDFSYENETANFQQSDILVYNSTEEFTNTYSLDFLNFSINFNASSAEVIGMSPAVNDVAVISVIFDVSKLDPMFVSSYSCASDKIAKVEFQQLSMDFHINVKTGYLVKTVRKDTYNMTPTVLNQKLLVTAVTTETYHIMNKSFNIKKPAYLY